MSIPDRLRSFFFFNDTATTEIYTLSLHDALPISRIEHTGERITPEPAARSHASQWPGRLVLATLNLHRARQPVDRKSTRLNSSHANISYAVFCLKKK